MSPITLAELDRPRITTIETFQLAVPTTKIVRTTLDAEVEKQTLAVEDIHTMNEIELHAAHSQAIVGAVSSFVNRVRLVTEIYKRFQAGKTVGGCTNFKAYLVLYKAVGESAENAVRKAYYALKFEEKQTGEKLIPNAQRAGRKPAAPAEESPAAEAVDDNEPITVEPTAVTPAEAALVPDKQPSRMALLREWFVAKYPAFKLVSAAYDMRQFGRVGRNGRHDLTLYSLTLSEVKAIGEYLATLGVKA